MNYGRCTGSWIFRCCLFFFSLSYFFEWNIRLFRLFASIVIIFIVRNSHYSYSFFYLGLIHSYDIHCTIDVGFLCLFNVSFTIFTLEAVNLWFLFRFINYYNHLFSIPFTKFFNSFFFHPLNFETLEFFLPHHTKEYNSTF